MVDQRVQFDLAPVPACVIVVALCVVDVVLQVTDALFVVAPSSRVDDLAGRGLLDPETDGRLPSGQALGEAITQVDDATQGAPAYFMINCAHPTHFLSTLDPYAQWVGRLRAIRANASRLSHAELDAATELDRGDINELAGLYAELLSTLDLRVVGGCCGTDHEHVAAIATAMKTGVSAR
ncbi:MAG: homocysteine S-methyltransferase family protein [Acidimicrobiales bacterium]